MGCSPCLNLASLAATASSVFTCGREHGPFSPLPTLDLAYLAHLMQYATGPLKAIMWLYTCVEVVLRDVGSCSATGALCAPPGSGAGRPISASRSLEVHVWGMAHEGGLSHGSTYCVSGGGAAACGGNEVPTSSTSSLLRRDLSSLSVRSAAGVDDLCLLVPAGASLEEPGIDGVCLGLFA